MIADKIHCQRFGPWKNAWGYELSFMILDDLMILKAKTPDNKKIIKYHIDEDGLVKDIDLFNQDRRF
jgi:hypothetical protein